jgi:hypothetical protein
MEVCTKVVDGFSPLEQISTTWSDAQKGTYHQRSMHLLNCAILTKACDRILVSPVGTGKISLEVARCHLRIAFYRAVDLVRTLTEARRENAHLAVSPLEKGRSDSPRAGFVSFQRAGGERLLDLPSERNEIHRTLVTNGR